MRCPRILPIAALAIATLALSACGDVAGGDDGYGYTSSPAPLSAPPQPPGDGYGSSSGSGASGGGPATGGTATGGVALAARVSPDLGTIVTDAQGFTLYRFDQDKAKPPTVTCTGDCAVKWPPVVVDPEGQLTLQGVDQAMIGMVQRPDGASQLTINGWAVYRFSGDTTPGATTGHGVGNVWFAVTPDGKKAATKP
jgi:predicted lipoprotein with Yx(FWY)xxD motif